MSICPVLSYTHTDNSLEDAKPLAQALLTYTPLLSQSHPQLAARLDQTQKEQDALHPSDAVKLRQVEDADHNIGQMRLESIMDSEPINTRASFMIHLDGLVSLQDTGRGPELTSAAWCPRVCATLARMWM